MLAFLCVAGFRPGSRATLVSVKVAKTIDAQSGRSQEVGRQTEDRPTRCAQTSPQNNKSVQPKIQPAGVENEEIERALKGAASGCPKISDAQYRSEKEHEKARQTYRKLFKA